MEQFIFARIYNCKIKVEKIMKRFLRNFGSESFAELRVFFFGI